MTTRLTLVGWVRHWPTEEFHYWCYYCHTLVATQTYEITELGAPLIDWIGHHCTGRAY